MKIKQTLLGAMAYTLVTFPLAVAWHVVIFKEQYQAFGYFKGEPSFVIGMLTIIIQGLVLSFLFPFVSFQGNSVVRGVKYALLVGLFFWTSHVLAFVAKQVVSNSAMFIVMESIYLLLQFGVFGLLLGLIFNNNSAKMFDE